MTPQQRESIIELASSMYVREGIKTVRMDDIAKQAGISKRTLYETFGDKEELIYLSMQYFFNGIYVEYHQAAIKTPNILIAMLVVMDMVIKNSGTTWKLRNSLARFFPKVYKRLLVAETQDRQSRFRDGLVDGVKAGLVVPRANLDLAISMLQYMSRSVVMGVEELILPESVTPQDAFWEVTVNVIRGISTAKGIEIIDNYISQK